MTGYQKRLERAWAAGFFDGEGCTGISKQPGGYIVLRMAITQKDRRVLDRFQRAVEGLGSIYLRQRGTFVWTAGGDPSCHRVLDLLWPYLSDLKRTQANEAIEKRNFRAAMSYGEQRKRGLAWPVP